MIEEQQELAEIISVTTKDRDHSRTEGFPSSKAVRNEEVTYRGIIKTLFQMGCMLSLLNLTLQEG